MRRASTRMGPPVLATNATSLMSELGAWMLPISPMQLGAVSLLMQDLDLAPQEFVILVDPITLDHHPQDR